MGHATCGARGLDHLRITPTREDQWLCSGDKFSQVTPLHPGFSATIFERTLSGLVSDIQVDDLSFIPPRLRASLWVEAPLLKVFPQAQLGHLQRSTSAASLSRFIRRHQCQVFAVPSFDVRSDAICSKELIPRSVDAKK